MAVTRAEVDDEDTTAAERRGDGPARRTLCRRGGLSAQAGEYRPWSDGVDVDHDVPYHPHLLLRRIDTHASH